jgi:predicted metal-dependent hydrolase
VRRRLIDAAREFNAGRYFEAHEALEEGLDDVPGELWELFIGLIQIAVGYHKISQGLASGATRMLALGLEKVEPFPADAADLDLAGLRERARRDLERLRSGRLDTAELERRPPRLRPLGRR